MAGQASTSPVSEEAATQEVPVPREGRTPQVTEVKAKEGDVAPEMTEGGNVTQRTSPGSEVSPTGGGTTADGN